MIGKLFGPILFMQEIVNLALHVFILNSIVTFGGQSLSLSLLCLSCAIGITIRMICLYWAIANIYFKSNEFQLLINKYKFTVKNSSLSNVKEIKIVSAEGKTLKPMFIRPWGIHRITPRSMSDYMLALFSYYYTVRNV